MKKIILGLLLALMSFSATSSTSQRPSFDSWLQGQKTLLSNPSKFVCTYACVDQYYMCYRYMRYEKRSSKNQNSCTTLYSQCTTMCSLLTEPSSGGGSGSSGGSSGGGSSGSGSSSQGSDGSTTPPDTDPSNDETNNPGDGSTPVL